MNLGTPADLAQPDERSNYRHLVLDIWWYGLAFAATNRFLPVYAIRLGATPLDLGLISALPAVIQIMSAGMGGWWIRHHKDLVRSSLLPSLGLRLLFLLPALAPFLPVEWQPAWIIASVTVPAIPQGIAGVTFLVIMRGAIHDKHITALMSTRMLAFNTAIGIAALVFGVWLENTPFPFNYQAMFVVAFCLALISTHHLLGVRLQPAPLEPTKKGTNPWRSSQFLRVAFVVMVSHVTFTMIVPLTPLRLVEDLGATEGFMALFGLAELVAGATVALFTRRVVERIGNRAMIALAMVGTAMAGAIIALSPMLPLTLVAAALSGASWTAVGIGIYGFFTQAAPYEGTARYSTAYQQTIGLAMFLGPMIGSILVQSGSEVVLVLLAGSVLRFLAGVLIENGLFSRVGTVTRTRLTTAARTK